MIQQYLILLLIELTNNHMLCSVLPTENSEALSMSLLFRVFVLLIAVILGITHVVLRTDRRHLHPKPIRSWGKKKFRSGHVVLKIFLVLSLSLIRSQKKILCFGWHYIGSSIAI